MEKLQGTSMDIVQDNMEKLKQIFPEIFTEGKIDFEILKQLLGEKIENDKERYSFTWKGKTEARQIAQDTSTGTLRPSKEDSKDWENTENLYIEGDNLEVLKLLQKSYHGKIKMIYIDPPYNTGKDFVYKDNFRDNIDNYLTITGQKSENRMGGGYKLTTNTESNGRYHSDWLNMMYPRLKLARNLLTDDGVICIQIDDKEYSNLIKLCEEVFGHKNIISTICVKMSHLSGMKMSHKEKKIPKIKEYIIVVCNNIEKIYINPVYIKGEWNTVFDRYTSFLEKENENLDSWKRISLNTKIKSLNLKAEKEIEEFKLNNANLIFRTAINDTLKDYPKDNKFYKAITKTGLEKLIYNKEEVLFASNKLIKFEDGYFPAESLGDIWVDIGINNLHKEGDINFPNGKKPLKLLKRLLMMFCNKDSIIMDFFSGSASTAHSVMQLNLEDDGNRKYIMVQLPENLETSLQNTADKEIKKALEELINLLKQINKPNNICEIGKERIRRAGEKIKEEIKKENSQLKLGEEPKKVPDIGFKVFKLDSSNIKEWDSETEDLEQSLFDSIDNIKSDRTSLDILYEILLKYGLDLNVPIIENDKFYSIGGGTLLINLDKEIDMEVINSICEEYKNLLEIDEDFKTMVVLRDSAFKNDVDKTNAMKKLEQVGIKEVRSI